MGGRVAHAHAEQTAEVQTRLAMIRTQHAALVAELAALLLLAAWVFSHIG
jgi:hypothetical protein